MKLGIISDLHTELWGKKEYEKIGSLVSSNMKDADIVLLSGDIGKSEKAIKAANRLFPDKPVCIVAGNHEFWGNSHKTVIDSMTITAKKFPLIHFLNRDTFVLDGVRIIGATLWTDFDLFGTQALSMAIAGFRSQNQGYTIYPDFYNIINDDNDLINPSEMLEWHIKDKEWLFNEIDKPFDGKTVIMTHHAPVSFAIPEWYKTDRISPCFASRLENHILERPVDVCVWGHTHYCVDTIIENTHFISNQVGYLGIDIGSNAYTETGEFGTIIVL